MHVNRISDRVRFSDPASAERTRRHRKQPHWKQRFAYLKALESRQLLTGDYSLAFTALTLNDGIFGFVDRGTTKVTLTNEANADFSASDRADIRIVARPVTAVDSSTDIEIGKLLNQKVGIAIGASKAFNVNLTVPATVLAGDYHLIAIAKEPVLTGGAQIASVTSGADFTVAAQELDLHTTLGTVKLPAAVTSGNGVLGSVQVKVTNDGNIKTASTEKAQIKIVARPIGGGSDIVLTTLNNQAIGNLGVNATKTFNVTTTVPIAVGTGDFAIAVIVTDLGPTTEVNAGNNTAVGSTVNVTQGVLDLHTTLGAGTHVPVASVSGNGSVIPVQVIITNDGNINANTAEKVNIQFVARSAGGGSDIVLKTLSNQALGSLKVNATKSFSTTVTLPNSLDSQNWQIAAIVTDAGPTPETNAGNNVALSSSIAVTQGVLDLQTTLGAGTHVPVATIISGNGALIPVQVILTNNGTIHASSTEKVDIEFVARPTGGGSDIPLKTLAGQSIAGLKANTSKSFSTTLTLPNTLDTDSFNIVAIVTDTGPLVESNAGNNAATSASFNVTQGVLDLHTTLGVGTHLPATATSGDGTTFPVQVTIANDSISTISASGTEKVDIQFFARPVGGGPDIVLKTLAGQSIAGLKANNSKSFTTTLTLPTTLDTEAYVIGAVVTDVGPTTESNAENNIAVSASSIAVTQGFVDLETTFGAVTIPTGIIAGHPASGSVQVKVKNVGNISTSTAEKVDLTLVLHPTGGGEDIVLKTLSAQSVGNLKQGGIKTFNIPVSLLDSPSIDTYELIATATDTTVDSDTNASNDSATFASDIVVAEPFVDLTVDHTTTAALAGRKQVASTGTIDVFIQNVGNIPSTGYKVEVYATTDGTIDSSTSPIGTTLNTTTKINPGGIVKATVSGTLPGVLSPTDFILVARVTLLADTHHDNDDFEANTVNVASPFIDATITDTATATLMGEKLGGASGSMDVFVKNQGNMTAVGYKVELFATTDGSIDSGDLPIGTTTVNGGQIKADTTTKVTVNATLPSPVSETDYTLLARVTVVGDTESSNNIFTAGTVTIRSPFVDLGVNAATTTLAATVAGGATGVANVTLENLGNVPSTGYLVEVFATTDGNIPDGAAPIGTAQSANAKITSGGTLKVPVNVTLPAPVAPTTYTLVARVTLGADTNAANDTGPIATSVTVTATPGLLGNLPTSFSFTEDNVQDLTIQVTKEGDATALNGDLATHRYDYTYYTLGPLVKQGLMTFGWLGGVHVTLNFTGTRPTTLAGKTLVFQRTSAGATGTFVVAEAQPVAGIDEQSTGYFRLF